MRRHHDLPVGILVVNSISILRSLTARKRIAILPVHVTTSVDIIQRRRLPGILGRGIVVEPKFLEHARLARRRARLAVVGDPRVAPLETGRHAPALRVQVVGAVVDGGDLAVGVPVDALGGGVRVGIVRALGEAEPFVADGDHVLRVERLDVGRGGLDPVGQDGGGAALAAGFVGELPGEDGGGVGVAGHDGFDVGLVLGLGFGARVPFRVGGDAGVGEIGRHAAVVGPVVDEVDDELDVVGGGGLDHGVEALQAVGTGVDGRYAVDKGLVVDRAGAGDGRHVVESPDAQDLDAGGLQVGHDGVDVSIVVEEADPVGVCAYEVLLLAVNVE